MLVGRTNTMLRVPVLAIVGAAAWTGPMCAVSGCAARASFEDDEPASQLAALDRAIEANDRSKIPDIIGLLDSDDPAVRMFAILGLRRMTGETLGYDFAAPEAERDAATERWVAWYNSQSGAEQPIEGTGPSDPEGGGERGRAEAGSGALGGRERGV